MILRPGTTAAHEYEDGPAAGDDNDDVHSARNRTRTTRTPNWRGGDRLFCVRRERGGARTMHAPPGEPDRRVVGDGDGDGDGDDGDGRGAVVFVIVRVGCSRYRWLRRAYT